MSLLAVSFHVLAERVLFRSKKEFKEFAAPFEGVFVISFGAILPGLGLLAYGVHSLLSSAQNNPAAEVAKSALLLVVPLFNLFVWSAVRKGYLLRPRLTGLMNGLSLGLSLSWMCIWLKCLVMPSAVPCKFGWMLLLSTSPFLLFASICLFVDLRQRTEPHIRRITSAFSLLGSALSLLFVFAPMAGALSIQSLLDQARDGTGAQKEQAMSVLRATVSPEELRSMAAKINGFTLSSLLVPNQCINGEVQSDKDLFFQITGLPYSNALGSVNYNSAVGPSIDGLSLSKSQLSGNVGATTLTAALDWMMTFKNATTEVQEACAEISLPKGAVVSRVTLWINGEPCEGAFAPTAAARTAYNTVVRKQKDPLLVSMSGSDRILVQCFPVPAGGNVKVRLGFKLPLQSTDGATALLSFPEILSANFNQPKRQRISIMSSDSLHTQVSGISELKRGEQYYLSGIIRRDSGASLRHTIELKRSRPLNSFVVRDWLSPGKQYIFNQLQRHAAIAPKDVYVVVDSSASLANAAAQINSALRKLETTFDTHVYVVPSSFEDSIKGLSVQDAEQYLSSNNFVGGKDNQETLKEALETAAETPHSAVVWIHGPQPSSSAPSQKDTVDLVNAVALYDIQIVPGPVKTIETLRTNVDSNLLNYVALKHETIESDFSALVQIWQHPLSQSCLSRTAVVKTVAARTIEDKNLSAEVTTLWADEEVRNLLARSEDHAAESIGERYRLISPVTAAVVLEKKDYSEFRLNPGEWRSGTTSSITDTYRGIAGAPVDPRFGQSNEVGSLADYGYDTARDIARLLTMASFVFSLVLAFVFVRSRPNVQMGVIAKAVGLVVAVPSAVHLFGTFTINNFGGLGGGL